MNLVKLIENIHKEYVYVQSEREQIHQLNLDLNDEIESTFNLTWIIRNQRYLCDKLNINGAEYLELIDELNQNENAVFVKGFKKFGSNEIFLSQLLQYLRSNPKSVSYLLFYAEKECTGFLDPLCKIILSTVYSHCQIDQDRNAIVDLMEEMLEIYLNFHNDIRRQIHSKYSSFCLVYRNFCDELSELKTFYKLALYQPIMQVLAEDSLFLDVDSSRAAMRFFPKEREKHFGVENSDEYRENLAKYKKWTLKKLKLFIDNFINALRSNIFAFPQSLATLIIRVYSKLIEHLEFQKVYAICIDLIFCFLICPAIQNPDLFGITDLHVNHISHYNLLQCAQIIQLLALSKWEKCNSTYQEVCDLFDKDCLSFVIDHILGIFNNFSLPKSIYSSSLPYFLISEFELKLLLDYIKLLLADNDQNDNPIKTYFDKLPESVRNFQLDNTGKSESLTRKSKPTESVVPNLVDLSEIICSQNEDFVSNYKLLFVSRTILQISNETLSPKMIGLIKEKDFLSKVKERRLSISEDVDDLVKEVENLFLEDIVSFHATADIKQFNNNNSPKNHFDFGKMVDLDATNLLDSTPSGGHMDLLNAFDNRPTEWSTFKEEEERLLQSTFSQQPPTNDFSDLFSMQSLASLSLNLKESETVSITGDDLLDLTSPSQADKNEVQKSADLLSTNISVDTVDNSSQAVLLDLDPTFTSQQVEEKKEIVSIQQVELSEEKVSTDDSATASRQQHQRGGSVHKKGFFSLSNFKNIKDKVKNISIKENKSRHPELDRFNSFDTLSTTPSEDNILGNLAKERFDIENVKAKTTEILEKYKSSSNKSASEELLCLDNNQPKEPQSLIDVTTDEVDHHKHQPVDQFGHIKNKLRKLMCLVNLSHAYQSYRFLNLGSKHNFVMFLKILLSQARNMDEVSNTVLIIDMIRVMDGLSENDFINIFHEIEADLKLRNLFSIYLLKSRQYLQFRMQCIKSTQMTLRKEQYLTNFIIVSFLIRQLMERKDNAIQQLIARVTDPNTLADEKVSLVENMVHNTVESDACRCLTSEQYSLAKQIIERHLIGRIYLSVFYSIDGDIDKMRDQILHQQISQLSKSITPSSKLLKIPPKYFTTAPWSSAQAELWSLSAYKTARDKVQCICRCCSHIITLLSTSDNTIPAADDLLPVLIFVAIKANPTSILSTIQYVNSFYAKDLIGEEAYYWTQFCSVIEFIKTVINNQQ